MEATITTTGNQRDGYEITLTLPMDWLDRFSPRMAIQVHRELIYPHWGKGADSGSTRSMIWHIDDVHRCRAIVAIIKGEIRDAKNALSQGVVIDHCETIDL